MAGLAQPGDGLGPAGGLFDPLADAQADIMAGVACGSPVDRRAPSIAERRALVFCATCGVTLSLLRLCP